jgi:NifB/MoaA-like Fe-S oxidoreductase
VASVAVVPVGLTGYRRRLYPLRPVSGEQAAGLIERIESWQERYRREFGSVFVHAADELYLLSGRPVPEADRYEGFDQLENGVGMVRQWLDRFGQREKEFPCSLAQPRTVTIVTGRLAEPLMRRTLADRLSHIEGLTVHLRAVENRLFGGGVTVSGLLAGRDILEEMRARPAEGMVLLPPNCLNEEGLFLDDLTPGDLAGRLGLEVIAADRNDPLRSLEKVFA